MKTRLKKSDLLLLVAVLLGVLIGLLVSGPAWSLINSVSDKSSPANLDGWYSMASVPYFDHGALAIDDINGTCTKDDSAVRIYYSSGKADVYCYVDADNCTKGNNLSC